MKYILNSEELRSGMKKIISLVSILILTFMMFTACAESKPYLEGKYSTTSFFTTTSYDFDREGNVRFKIVTSGFVAYDEKGKYEINEEENEITLQLPTPSTKIVGLSIPTIKLNGTFTFSKDKESITIGNIQFNKVSEGNE